MFCFEHDRVLKKTPPRLRQNITAFLKKTAVFCYKQKASLFLYFYTRLSLLKKIPLIYTDKIPKFLYLCNLFQKITNGK